VSVWYAIPSARPANKAQPVLDQWRRMGYRVAVQRDLGAPCLNADYCVHRVYQFYGESVNYLCRLIVESDPDALAVVTGGDDIYPDPGANPAQVAAKLVQRTGGTLWVMQPTGDRWPVDQFGVASVEKVCVSPWLGREWILRAYRGQGPYPKCYYHYFADEELFEVARNLSCLILEPTLCQYHAHWMRHGEQRPTHLEQAGALWQRDQALFVERKQQGFPGHELLAAQHTGA
jgi:hypothetical protein